MTKTSLGAAARFKVFCVALTLVVVVTGMAYSFWWASVVRHHDWYWLTPGDLWAIFRNAHYVQWGSLPYIYSANTHLVTLPGYAVLLAPVAVLCSALGLTESSPTVLLPKPEAWLLLGPFILLTAAIPTLAADRLASLFQLVTRRRLLLAVAVAAAVWPTLAIWGHPEDALAIGLALFAIAALANGSDSAAAWLLSGAIAMQLFAVYLVPIVLVSVGAKRAVPALLRMAFLPSVLLVAVLVPNFHDSWSVLLHQPGFPGPNHPTPWILLAPHIAKNVVAAGPARIVGAAVVIGCGIAVRRGRRDLEWLLWLAAVAMAARCLFEAVMVTYYVMPVVVPALALAFRQTILRGVLAAVAGAGVTVMTYFHANMWIWWFEMAGLLLAMLALTCPALHMSVLDRTGRESRSGVDYDDQSEFVGDGRGLLLDSPAAG